MKRSLRSWLWRVDITEEVDEELAFHIEMRTRELVEKGVDPRIAREMVLARLGDATRIKRTCIDLGRKRDREMRLTQWLEEFTDDVRFAFRQLKTSPGFALVAILTLALGIGANSAMFALADATLVQPLPFPEPHRLVVLSELFQGQPVRPVNPVDFVDWSERTNSFTAIAAVVRGGGSIVGDDGVAEPIPGQAVTARFFDVLGVRPIAGRTFRDDDEGPAPDVVVLSEGFWRRRFGADPRGSCHSIQWTNVHRHWHRARGLSVRASGHDERRPELDVDVAGPTAGSQPCSTLSALPAGDRTTEAGCDSGRGTRRHRGGRRRARAGDAELE